MNGFPNVAVAQKLKFKGEDRAAVQIITNGVFYAGVFDGHNGPSAAIWCAENMAKLIEKHYESGLGTVAALKRTFIDADEAITDKSGTTASIVLIKNRYIAIAHVGDSRVVLCHGGIAVTITEDHHLDLVFEKQRIQSAEIAQKEELIFGSRVQGLMLTRSIGDHTLDKAITPYPVVNEFLQTKKDEFLIIASDGLWDVCDGQTAIEVVKQQNLASAEEIADALVYYACGQYQRKQLRADDITCCVVVLKSDHDEQTQFSTL